MLNDKWLVSTMFATALMLVLRGSAVAAPSTVANLHTGQSFLFNDDAELCNDGSVTTVASTTVKAHAGNRLLIQYSSVGAITNSTGSGTGAILFLGAFIDGTPAIGSQSDPGGTPGYVNVLSVDFPAQAAWDSAVDHVWFSDVLPKVKEDAYTVEVKTATGNALISFLGAAGICDEARNLVVTVLH